MPLINSIKKLFGFGATEEYEEYTEAPEAGSNTEPQVAPAAPAAVDTERTSMIFEHVVAVFNSAIPDFLAKSVDPEAQKRLLYEGLDADLKSYVEQMAQDAQEQCRQAWGTERDKMRAEADELRRKAKDLETKRSELNDKQLSSDRQKRALAERVHDLESKVLALEAEKEQLEIENKSLINKAKVANVQEAELEELRAALSSSGGIKPEVVTELKEKVAVLQKEVAEKAKELEATKTTHNIGDAMITEFRKKADEAVAAEKEAKGKAADLENQVSVLNAKTTELEKAVAQKDSELQAAKLQISESLSPEQVQELNKQIDGFAKVRERLDSEIGLLTDKLRTSEEENESLRATIHANLIEHSRRQQEMQMQIDELRTSVPQDLSADPAEEYEPKPKPKAKPRKRARTSAATAPAEEIDNLLEGADWLVATPPEGTSMRPHDEEPFGYQPPQRKKTLPTADLPSLFDL